jgi:hypothetical protein
MATADINMAITQINKINKAKINKAKINKACRAMARKLLDKCIAHNLASAPDAILTRQQSSAS